MVKNRFLRFTFSTSGLFTIIGLFGGLEYNNLGLNCIQCTTKMGQITCAIIGASVVSGSVVEVLSPFHVRSVGFKSQ